MIYELASMMATMMIIVVILLAITKDRKGLKLNSPRQACHIMPSLIPSPRPLSDDKLSLVAPFCSPSAILSPSDQKMTINIFQPIVLFSAQFHKITRTEAILLHYFTISCQIDSHLHIFSIITITTIITIITITIMEEEAI